MDHTTTDARQQSRQTKPRAGRKDKKVRLTVSLSPQSMKAFHELRDRTDADTDSEVVRNALRLHLALMRAEESGKELFLRSDNSDQLVASSLRLSD